MDTHTDAAGASLFAERYVLGELLGVGGSASVFMAHDARPEPGEPSVVALKLLHPHLAHEESARQAFLREAQRAATLADPHIPRIRGAGVVDAGGVMQPWIALDLVAGPTLRDRVRESGPLPPTVAAAVVTGILAALSAAHAAGVVHRDLSPQNIMLAVIDEEPLTESCVRVLDFGLADITGHTTVGRDILLADAGSGDGGARAGIVGNAHYMSPEQAEGKPVRAPSDLYQAGALLYFALTGKPPFPRATVTDVLQAHVSAPPPVPSALVPAARPFDRIVTRAMTKTPARRFRDPAEFRDALADAVAAIAPTPAGSASDDGVDSASVVASAPPEDEQDATRVTRVLSPARGGLGVPAALVGPAEPAAPARYAPSPASSGAVAIVVTAALLVGAGMWAGLSGAARTTAEPVFSPTAETTPPTPEPTVAADPTPLETPAPVVVESVLVPALAGTLADAERMLQAVGLTLGEVTRVDSPWDADTVLRHEPQAGASVPQGSAVTVTVASGQNLVPSVVGLEVATARLRSREAGFALAASDETLGGAVRAQTPAAGSLAPVGSEIVVTVTPRTPTPTPTPTPTSTTTPGVP